MTNIYQYTFADINTILLIFPTQTYLEIASTILIVHIICLAKKRYYILVVAYASTVDCAVGPASLGFTACETPALDFVLSNMAVAN